MEQALASGQIKAGQSVDEIVMTHGPFHIETVGSYQRLADPKSLEGIGFEGYVIVARDNRLVGAGWWTCVGHIKFFDTLTPAEGKEANRVFRIHRQQKWEVVRNARMAVLGAAAQIAWEGPPTEFDPEL